MWKRLCKPCQGDKVSDCDQVYSSPKAACKAHSCPSSPRARRGQGRSVTPSFAGSVVTVVSVSQVGKLGHKEVKH